MSSPSFPNHFRIVFDADQTAAFAALCGDYNPLHLDPIGTRRLIFGSTVAHGIHVLLTALERWADLVIPGAQWRLTTLDVSFDRPVPNAHEAVIQIKECEDDHSTVTVVVGNQTAVRLKFSWKLLSGPQIESGCRPQNPGAVSARRLPLEEATRESGRIPLHLNVTALRQLLPGLAAGFSIAQVSRLLATTRLVGMVYPGLHSIYSRLHLDFSTESIRDDDLHYEVAHLDPRFSSVTLRNCSGEAKGEILSFFRPEPCPQTETTALKNVVSTNEFIGQRALVVGGSRGLGEVTAKILATGGAQVLLTYSRGEEEARRIAEEIVQDGGSARYLQWDARKTSPFGPGGDPSPTHLYYFATPKIATGRKGHFSPALFHDFCEFYLTAFNALMEQFPDLIGLFYPFSVFVDDIPANLAEYAASKAAGENLCRFYEKTRPSLSVLCPRLPRLATDQTVGLKGSTDPDPAEFLLSLLPDLQKASRDGLDTISNK
jgi:hypothetical protein